MAAPPQLVRAAALAVIGLSGIALSGPPQDTKPPGGAPDGPGEGTTSDLAKLFDVGPGTQWRTKDFRVEDGLPSVQVTALAYGASGRLWIGTANGLATFDGNRIEPLDPLTASDTPEGRPRRHGIAQVSALQADRESRIWVGGATGRIARYDDHRAVPVAIDSPLANIETLHLAEDGAIWAGGDGLVRITSSAVDLVIDPLAHPGLRVTALAQPPDDVDAAPGSGGAPIWVGTNRGLFRWDERDGLESVHSSRLSALFFDASGHRWEIVDGVDVTLDGVEQFSLKEHCGKFSSAIEVDARRTLVVLDRRVLMATLDGAGARMEESRVRYSISAAIPGAGAALWTAAAPIGLHHIELRPFEYLPIPLVGNRVDIVGAVGQRSLVVGSKTRAAAFRFELERGGWSRNSRLAEGTGVNESLGDLFGTARASDGRGYLATSRGVFVMDADRARRSGSSAAPATLIVAGEDGAVWALVGERLVEFRGREATGRAFEIPGRRLVSVVPKGSRLYATSGDSILSFDLHSMKVSTAAEVTGAPLEGLHVDDNGDLWATTNGDGLLRRRATGEIDRWSVEHGLPSRFMAWIGVVPGPTQRSHLWINSSAGAICISRRALEAPLAGGPPTLNYHLVPTPEANGVQGVTMESGHLILPTRRGAVAIDTRLELEARALPKVSIGVARADGVPLDDRHVHPGHAHLEFEFDAVVLPSSRSVRVEYRLDGHDDEWISAGGERTARYAHLAPGTYRFQVRAAALGDSTGVTTAAPVVVIEPSWYQRSDLRLALALLIAATTALVFRAQRRSFRKRSHILESEVERRTVAETRLRAERARFESVLETAHEGIFSFDESGMILYANAAMGAVFGSKAREFAGCSVTELGIAGLANEASLASLMELDDPSTSWSSVETRAVRADGSSVAVEVSLATDRSIEPQRFVGVVRDVTDRREMTRRLLVSQQRYRGLFQAAPTPIMAWNAECEMVDWNAQAAGLFGEESFLSERSFLDGFAAGPDDAHRLARSLAKVHRTCAAVTFVMQTRVTEFDVRACRWHLAPVVREDQTVAAFISIVVDLSDDLRVEKDLRDLRMQLARAEESERARIARELHDDFSQRLAALAINLKITHAGVSDVIDATSRASLEDAYGEIQTLATDVHSLSRRLHPTVLDDLGLAVALRAECSRRSATTDVKFSFEPSGNMERIAGDIRLALFRVAQESIQNALKHGAPTKITVRLRRLPGRIELSIADDGRGISRALTAGPGMGIVSMRERTQLVGGEFEVSTSPGAGTTVRASVPLDRSAPAPLQDDEALPVASTPESGRPRPSVGDRRTL